MPLLTKPAVVNMVHGGLADVNGISGSSEGTARKGPKPDQAWKTEERGSAASLCRRTALGLRAPDQRKALRLDRIGDEALRDLCSSLVHSPVDHLRCLRHVARVVRTG